jgi:hypothetical protein
MKELRVRHTLAPVLWPFLAFAIIVALPNPLTSQSRSEATKITVWFKPGNPVARFVPSHAFGAALDGHEKGEIDQMLSPKNVKEMLTAGLRFHNEATGSESGFEGTIDLYQYSRKQYELSVDKQEPYPIRDQPPEHRTLRGSKTLVVELPAYSITVMRGTGPVASQ